MRLMEHLLESVRDAAVFSSEVQLAPMCILLPDGDRQGEPVATRGRLIPCPRRSTGKGHDEGKKHLSCTITWLMLVFRKRVSMVP
jgi:hypothetical protein